MSIYRTTNLMNSSNLLSTLRQTQYQMQKASQQISTLKKVNSLSDAPSTAAAIMQLQRRQETRTQTDRNLQHATDLLSNIDQSLDDGTNILRDATSIASSQIGVGSTTETRKNQANIIDAQISGLLNIANRQVQGVSLFGGNGQPDARGDSFVDFLGGIRYTGSTTNLSGDVGASSPLEFNSNGVESFGAVSSRVQSQINLNPQATAQTHLADINGVQGNGVRPGSVVVTVNSVQMTVDLSSADTLDDVTTRINHAITNIDPAAGSLAIAGNGFSLTANAGNTITLGPVGSSPTAADLGLNLSAAGTTVAGGDLAPRLTAQSTLASLSVPVDLTGGLKITQGASTKVADFSSATTIQDMINTVNDLNLGVTLQINANGTGLNLTSSVSGLQWSVGENAGGTTAGDLGLRTFGDQTQLSDFRSGKGVGNVQGEADFQIQLHDGSSFDVDIDSNNTVGDLVTTMKDAATAAGLTVGNPGDAGTDINIGLASDGNGLSFEDGTAGGGDFKVVNLGLSLAATDLGIYTNAGSANSIQGQDMVKARVDNVFTHLINLRDALAGDDSSGITFAGEGLEKDQNDMIQARADIAVRAQRATTLQARSSDDSLSEKSALSLLQDADVTEAITKYSSLQTQLQASLQVGAQMSQLTLMDFLR